MLQRQEEELREERAAHQEAATFEAVRVRRRKILSGRAVRATGTRSRRTGDQRGRTPEQSDRLAGCPGRAGPLA